MIRPYFVVALLLVFILSCSITPVSNEKKVVLNAKAYVHKVTNIAGGHCSSVYVSYKNKVRHITNAHCCTEPLFLNGKGVKTVKVDIPNDLCELSHDSIPNSGVKISSNNPEVTDIVYSVGYSGPYDLTISIGRIVSGLYLSPVNGQLLFRTSSFCIGGNSGGAAFDEEGNLFGIMSQANGLNHGSFIPLTSIKAFLN